MAASEQTVIQIVDALEDRVEEGQLHNLIDDLKRINGNKSFRETVAAIEREVHFRETGER